MWRNCTTARQAVYCTYVVTLRLLRANIVAVESNKCYMLCVCVSVCVNFVLKYEMRKCHIVMYSLPHGTIFFHIIS